MSWLGMPLLQSDPTGALKFFEFAREQKPHSPISHLFIAICHEFKGNIDQAVAEARKAMGLLEKTTDLDNIDKKTFRDAAAALIKQHE